MYKIRCAGIYCISNKITGRYYIGLSTDIFGRWQSHYTQLKSNKHSITFKEDLDSYGVDSFVFEILEYVSITDFRRTSELKGKKLITGFRKYLTLLERNYMSLYLISKAYNKDNKYFKNG